MNEAGVAATPRSSAPVPAVRPIPLREILPWALVAGVLALMLLFLVGVEQGATSVFDGRLMHELVHDARHLLGFPCH